MFKVCYTKYLDKLKLKVKFFSFRTQTNSLFFASVKKCSLDFDENLATVFLGCIFLKVVESV